MGLRQIYKGDATKIVTASIARKLIAEDGWTFDPSGKVEAPKVSVKPAKKKSVKIQAQAEVKETPAEVDVELTIKDDLDTTPNQEENE